MTLVSRELPDGARQPRAITGISLEQRTENRLSRLRRVRPIPRILSAGENRNKSGTAEVYYAFVSCRRDKGVFHLIILWR